MLTDTQAQRIAAQWHGGGGSALYQFASTGALDGEINDDYEYNPVINELNECRPEPGDNTSVQELWELVEYVYANFPRPAVPDWYTRVICGQE